MQHIALIFGSSKDLHLPYWRVWSYDDATKSVIPLAHFGDKTKSDTAAFDLAHAAGSLEDPAGIDGILASKDSAPTPLPPRLSGLLAHLAEEAIQESGAPLPGKSAVTVMQRPDDTVYVVRIPKGAEPGAAPNGGPATPLGNSGATEGPPSVS